MSHFSALRPVQQSFCTLTPHTPVDAQFCGFAVLLTINQHTSTRPNVGPLHTLNRQRRSRCSKNPQEHGQDYFQRREQQGLARWGVRPGHDWDALEDVETCRRKQIECGNTQMWRWRRVRSTLTFSTPCYMRYTSLISLSLP